MPQLMNLLRKQNGSVLVGVVTIALVMAIAGAGLMMTSANTASHEATALNNDKAFLAAESGLLMGTSWLAMQDPWPVANTNQNIVTGFSINEFTVDVKDSVGSDAKVFIISTATSTKLPYTKRLSWQVDSIGGGGSSSIIENLTGVPKGLSGLTIDGPAHFNTDIILAAGGGMNPNRFMNGLVSVHSSNDSAGITSGSYYGASRTDYTNNYQYGVRRYNSSNLTATDCDGIFMDRYLSKQYRLALDYTVQNSIMLPVSGGGNIPTLAFQDTGGAVYTYFDGTSWTSIPYPSSVANGKIFLAPNDASINVYGTVNGQFSVATQGTMGDIHIVGEIIYKNGFTRSVPTLRTDGSGTYENSGNYGVNETGTDVVALFSNRDIILESQWTSSTGTQNFITSATKSFDNSYIVGMLWAKGSIDMDYQGTFGASQNAYFMGTRSATTFGSNFWDRGNDFNPTLLYDKRFGAGVIRPAGVTMILHRYDDNNNKRIGIKESRWTELNVASN